MAEIDWKDISSEKRRTYVFPGGDEVAIILPSKLNVSASGGHRILDVGGISHYIPSGWIHLYWQVKEGQLPFSF